MRRLFFLLVCFSLAYTMLGQQPTTHEGVLKDAEFIIKKERKHLLPEASRLFESAPTQSRVIAPTKPVEYDLPDLCLEFDTLPCRTKLLRAKPGRLAKLYGNYVQGRYGNYHSPFLELFLASKYHPRYAYDLRVRHLSAGKKTFFEEKHNLIQLHGKLYTETLRLTGAVGYDRNQYQLYNSDDNPAPQGLQQVMVRSTLDNYIYEAFHYQVDASFHGLADDYQARESQWQFNGRGDYELSDTWMLKTFTDLYLTRHRDATVVHRNLWRLKPMLFAKVNRFDVQGGINLVYQNDAAYASNALHVYPVLEVKYAFHKWLQPYLGVNGDIQQNFLQGILEANPYLASNADLRHTNQRFLFYGGARGDVLAQLNWHAGFSVGAYQNFYCLVNSVQEPGRFDICYDPAAKLFNTFCELTHTNSAETLTTRLRGDYFYYTLQKLSEPWHRPKCQLYLLSTYRFYNKLVCKGAMYWMRGVVAQHETTKASMILEDILNVNLGIEYFWSARFSIALDFKNLFARKNERYLYYPSHGFQYMLGLTYAW